MGNHNSPLKWMARVQVYAIAADVMSVSLSSNVFLSFFSLQKVTPNIVSSQNLVRVELVKVTVMFVLREIHDRHEEETRRSRYISSDSDDGWRDSSSRGQVHLAAPTCSFVVV